MGERNNPLLKKLDKWVGCPLTFGLGLFHRDQPCPVLSGVQKPRIALIKTAAVGDTIVLSAMVREIRHTYPEAIITVICSKNNLAMVKILPGIDAYYSFEMKKPLASLHHIKSLGRFDLLLDFGPWPRIPSSHGRQMLRLKWDSSDQIPIVTTSMMQKSFIPINYMK